VADSGALRCQSGRTLLHLRGAALEIPCRKCSYLIWTYGLDRKVERDQIRVVHPLAAGGVEPLVVGVRVYQLVRGQWLELEGGATLLEQAMSNHNAARLRHENMEVGKNGH
jgi:hypothetical protein